MILGAWGLELAADLITKHPFVTWLLILLVIFLLALVTVSPSTDEVSP